MDTATASLDHIFKSGKFTVVKNVPVFNEHDEFDGDGKLVRKFDRAALQKIATACNKRAKETGDLSPFGPGHTIADAPEERQPLTYGYAANFRVDNYGPEKKLGILADFHVSNKIRTREGNEVDGMPEFLSYKRRSIELWLKDGIIDHIALLRRTPQRDLGLIEFAKGHEITIPSTNNLFSAPQRQGSLAAAVRRGKLCYSMEHAMPMDNVPAMQPDQQGGDQFDPNGDEHKQFCQHADHYMKSKYGEGLKQYEAASSGPSGSNTFVPGDDNDKDKNMGDPTIQPKAKDDDDVVKMARQFATADPAVKVAQYERLLQRLKDVETSNARQVQQFSKDDAVQRVTGLIRDGYVMDSNEEIKEFESRPLGEARDKYAKKIVDRYQRDMFNAPPPASGPMFNLRDPNGKKDFSKVEVEKIRDYAIAKGVDYADARRALHPDSN